jgi:carbonic anhydrase
MNDLRLACFAAVILLAACANPPRPSHAAAHRPSHATAPRAHDESGHADARALYAVPSEEDGAAQSPINILTASAVHRDHATAVHYTHAEALCVKNKGHTVEVAFPPGSTLDYDGKTYGLSQLHFHTPSEHQLDGVTYPMELHIVHVREGQAPGAPPEYLVVAIFYRMGTQSAFIQSFLDAVPQQGGTEADLSNAHVFVDQLLPSGKLPKHFHYRGSLTTPPYTETVEWLVLEGTRDASPAQIARINSVEGDNARHVHALHARTVEAE